MREILFRGKRKDFDNEWLEGFYTLYNDNRGMKPAIITGTEKYCFIPLEIIPETIGQYTGLTDKNGKKIFEGDIFKFPDEIFESYYTSCGTEYNSWETENYGVVGFCEEEGRFGFVDYKFNENAVEADLHENHAIEFYDFVSDLEIIGNMHDNPELLKGGAEE